MTNLLGIQEKFQTVQVHVLNNSVETFRCMPIKIDIESVNGDFGKIIELNTCPKTVTCSYKVEHRNEIKKDLDTPSTM